MILDRLILCNMIGLMFKTTGVVGGGTGPCPFHCGRCFLVLRYATGPSPPTFTPMPFMFLYKFFGHVTGRYPEKLARVAPCS